MSSSPYRDVPGGRLRSLVRRSRAMAARGWMAGMLLGTLIVRAAELEEVQRWYLDGKYPEVVEACATAVAAGERSEEWRLLLLRALLDTGRVPEARRRAGELVAADSRSIRLRWAAREAFQANGDAAKAAEMLEEIQQLVGSRIYYYRDPASLVAFGRSALALGIDPKQVLEKIYTPATQSDPKLRDAYLARGELALSKSDFELAGKVFDQGLAQLPDDPDLLAGRARACAESDREEMIGSLESALKRNARHVPSLLLLAEHRVDAEDYAGASNLLEQARSVNPVHPDTAALTAVLAHLRYDTGAEASARAAGLRYWTNNPRVDHLLGRKLSQKYRFAEGAERQRQALTFDPDYLPASAQLASDLLRLGEEAQGWQLAEEVHRRDAYDVAAYNLVTLHEVLTKFVTLTNAHFTVRLHASEAPVYGDRVLALLERARTTLVAKYGDAKNGDSKDGDSNGDSGTSSLQGAFLQEPTLVEIFHQQKDFGVRTFGLPENPGYLGVCFGRVITANSPATSRADPVNWEAVLWHEFCHVVTLQMTRNRMPRWFSEGISVFEETQENPAWGQALRPRYREMILGGELTPVSRLSAAFLMPKTPMHLQFAYFEAGLLVEFLVKRHGPEVIRQILHDLGDGGEINTALEKRVAPMAALEADFAKFAKERALALAPGLTWNKPPEPEEEASL
ncbi:MAG: tetratricopeptide repeat protein, partial [Verrucomicrobiae bacterium]|nr:tetratricopeptide repeat protein [Verrucomicrobiae bacterium]